MKVLPDGRYDLKSFATDPERQTVCAYAVFRGTHTGDGGPCPPTGKSVSTGLCVRDGVRRREDPSHDEDLERGFGAEAARVVTAAAGRRSPAR